MMNMYKKLQCEMFGNDRGVVIGTQSLATNYRVECTTLGNCKNKRQNRVGF